MTARQVLVLGGSRWTSGRCQYEPPDLKECAMRKTVLAILSGAAIVLSTLALVPSEAEAQRGGGFRGGGGFGGGGFGGGGFRGGGFGGGGFRGGGFGGGCRAGMPGGVTCWKVTTAVARKEPWPVSGLPGGW